MNNQVQMYIFPKDGNWMIETFNDTEMARLFPVQANGAVIRPTAFTTNMPVAEVVERIQDLNPGAYVDYFTSYEGWLNG